MKAASGAMETTVMTCRSDSRVTVVRLGGILRPSDWFVLDPHLQPSGHSKIAAILEQALRDAGLL